MNKFVIATDSACDLSVDLLKKWDVRYCELSFMFDDKEPVYSNYELTSKEFYDKLREGHNAKTSAANSEAFKEVFEGPLKEGYDVLYVGFTSGLSTTYNSGRMAGEELMEQYPDRKVIAVDTLSASAGLGLLVKMACDKRDEGATIEETAAYIEDMGKHMCHWVTVDDLVYLKRGGRISAATALVGGMLNIKPIIRVDGEGRLESVGKVRGRKAALKYIADKYEKVALNKKGVVFISHGDCLDDTMEMKKMLESRFGAKVQLITNVGPVIGAHTGPSVIAVCFPGTEK
ncbi:MAG: DegV family protein [Clostridia bacterium]|nr:DegV family protein [Clostridia bacterium]